MPASSRSARISGDGSASGGADSPEAAANLLLDALDNEDALGAVDVLLPGERETFREPMQRLMTQLQESEVLSDDSLSGVSGIDFVVSERAVEVDATNVDDIVNLTVSASVASTVDGEALPLGDWLREQIPEDDLDELEQLDEETEPEPVSFPVTAVEQDGRWYLSLFYTAAEQARLETDFDVPEEGIAPIGGETPEEAIDNVIDAVAALDLEAMVASLNPNEFEALQRYGPLFLDDGQVELDASIADADVSIDVSDTTYDVSGSGSTRSIRITGLAVDITAEGETLAGRLVDGCFIGTAPGETEEINTCDLQARWEEEIDLDDMVDDPQAVEDAIADIQAAFDDYENPGIIVKEVDGAWYLSPMATVADQVLAVMEALSLDEIEDLGDQFRELVDTFEDEVADGRFAVPDFDDFELPDDELTVPTTAPDATDDTVAPDDTITTTEDTVTDSTYVDDPCFELEAAGAQACFEDLVAAGRIDAVNVPWFFRFPECGAGALIWDGEYYALPDAEFVAQVEAWQPCVQGIIASGEAAPYEFDEVGQPQCLEGRNPYLEDVSNEDFDAFIDCVYG